MRVFPHQLHSMETGYSVIRAYLYDLIFLPLEMLAGWQNGRTASQQLDRTVMAHRYDGRIV